MRDYVRIKLKLTKPQEVQFITYPTERDLATEQIDIEKLKQVLGKTSIFRIGYKGFPKVIDEGSLYNYLFKK